MLYRYILKPILFCFDAESAHSFTTRSLGLVLKIPVISFLFKSIYRFEDERLSKKIWNLEFSNPVGLAAGFDKDGKYYRNMSSLGFGFIEIGTVTPLAQQGNPKKRLFRLPKDKALINRMGFNNEGVDKMIERLQRRKKSSLIIGGNIGKNKLTPNEDAIRDYEISFRKLYNHVDYFVINVSSPNTPGLRELQDKEPLTKLIRHLLDIRDKQEYWKPVLLKIAPDLTIEQLEDIIDIIKTEKLDGIIATNTTISRENLESSSEELENIGAGGLSGTPLKNRSCEIVRFIRSQLADIVIIGVGGIATPEDALKMLQSGADLIQVYTGLVYQGPGFIKKIKKSLLESI